MYMKGREKIWAEETREGNVEITAWSVGVWVWGQDLDFILNGKTKACKMGKGKGKPPNSNLLLLVVAH